MGLPAEHGADPCRSLFIVEKSCGLWPSQADDIAQHQSRPEDWKAEISEAEGHESTAFADERQSLIKGRHARQSRLELGPMQFVPLLEPAGSRDHFLRGTAPPSQRFDTERLEEIPALIVRS